MKTSLSMPGLILATLALGGCSDSGALVARAGGHDFPVATAVSMLVGEGFPNEPDVVRTVAEMWVDYVLLARAMAENPTLSQLDVSSLVEQQVEQELLVMLRDAFARPDTVVTEEQLQQHFVQATPGARVRARHILLMPPGGATPAQRDSLRELAESLLARVRAGESFERLAMEHSSDRASAADGGDLGWFGPNELIASLEQAAFALEPGQISEIVESVVGLHILRLDEREVPTFDDAREDVRAFILQERMDAAEAALVASVEQDANVEVVPGAADLARRILENPGLSLARRARARPIVRFRGGSFTVGEFVTFIQSRNDEFRYQVYSAPDVTIEQNLLVGLAQRKLLVERARSEGFSVPEGERDSMTRDLRGRLADAARELALVDIPVRDGENARDARRRKVEEILRDMLRDVRDVLPLGSFSYILRAEYSAAVYQAGVDQVVQRIADVRGPDTPPTAPPAPLDPGVGTP